MARHDGEKSEVGVGTPFSDCNAREDANLLSYLAAQLRNGTNVVDQGVGGAVGPADAEH